MYKRYSDLQDAVSSVVFCRQATGLPPDDLLDVRYRSGPGSCSLIDARLMDMGCNVVIGIVRAFNRPSGVFAYEGLDTPIGSKPLAFQKPSR